MGLTALLFTLTGLALGGFVVIRRLDQRIARVRPHVSRDWLHEYWSRREADR